MIDIYTDGACDSNPGRGGWAAIVIENGDQRIVSGGEPKTTNNRMEIMAAIKGLESIPPRSDVTVHSDSQYVINTITKNWKRNANTDLWPQLDKAVAARNVRWKWVRGHAGDPMNELADQVAKQEAGLARPNTKSVGLTHVDDSGAARMVDVGSKPDTDRLAVARGSVLMEAATLDLIKRNAVAKGDVLGTARTAGIMAAKKTSELIPLCHPIGLTHLSVELELDESRNAVDITATAKTTDKTGVEMEALTAVSVAALTIYDMCKAVDRKMRIDAVRLVKKTGGKSGDIILED